MRAQSTACPAKCQCRNVALRWCAGTVGCQQTNSIRISTCSSLVFVNLLKKDFSVQVSTSTRRVLKTTTVSRTQEQVPITRFDRPGLYRLAVHSHNKVDRLFVTVTRKSHSCSRKVCYCVDDVTGERYNPGQEWRRNTCTSCTCTLGAQGPRARCTVNPCGAKVCLGGFQPSVLPGQCCPECPSVCWNSASRRYAMVGAVWNEPCHVCRCLATSKPNGKKECIKTLCPPCTAAQSTRARVPLDPCCPQCPVVRQTRCMHKGREFNNNDEWGDGCQDCICKAGKVRCQPRACPALFCRDGFGRTLQPIQVPRRCCGSCPSCGRHPVTGQLRLPSSSYDGRELCTRCTCDAQANEVCSRSPCPGPEKCPHTTTPILITPAQPASGICCPTYSCTAGGCKDANNVTRRLGDRWRHACEMCQCLESGIARCRPDVCPAPPACPGGQLPVVAGRRDCCDTFTCPPCCKHQGKMYAENGTWTPPHDPCLLCHCTGCSVVCDQAEECGARLECPLSEEPVRIQGSCCPTQCRRLCPWHCGEQLYSIKFESLFNAQSFRYFPRGGRLTNLFLVAHDGDFTLWETTKKASDGVAKYVRRENSKVIQEELGYSQDRIHRSVTVPVSASPNQKSTLISVDHRHALVSAMSGILPSPDWFTGVWHSNLCDESNASWRKRVVVNLQPYDVGANSGRKFRSRSKDTKKRRFVQETRNLPKEKRQFTSRQSPRVQPVGRLIFELLTGGCPSI